ncbi:SRPBCC domain-containing protein [Nonomuraea phyllanthi]|uniref:SRPBCC domain-containing protein n=1 Tax=Nonomuraea phyllanthi TaxID=2219224 RepID=A0A5C4WNS3_9ACTN|nr:SRPBCC domain-containing protein [Nonomuraea phyllanthi]KAB8195350.1 SRPBCC domain-containing protein [Nonomuraea phyllanthi]QFY10517.1 SRPBCC domain-containing protein [Nonomuraea phyllanthi]
MGHSFERSHEAVVEATPEEVWEAISTGPGIDAWFMGRSDVADGVVRTAFGGGEMPPSAVTGAEPARRFAHASDPAPDGRFVAYEFLIEGRAGGSTQVRMVTSGFLPGDDWQDEFEAMSLGMEMFFATLAEYLTHFAGRAATPVTAFGPAIGDWPRAWERLHEALGGPPSTGDRVRLGPVESPVEGVVYFRNAQTLGIRSGDALYRFLQGFHGSMVAAHVLFGEREGEEPRWRAWLEELYGRP